MPQYGLRSVLLRSLIACDDPQGVIECRTTRKSRFRSQELQCGNGIEGRGTQKISNSLPSGKDESPHMDCRCSTEELPLMEVHREPQKFFQLTDSCRKRTSFCNSSKDIAKKDILASGDLEESIVILGRTQQASPYMVKGKKKQAQKIEGKRANEMKEGITNSGETFSHKYLAQCQISGGFGGESQRDCFDELREVIRDSLARQNLLPNRSSGEKIRFGRAKFDSSADTLSNRSSQSSTISYEFSTSECSVSTNVPQEKARCPNLIAKLMGLEEMPSKALQTTHLKQLERDNIIKQRRPVQDIDLHDASKSDFVEVHVNPGSRILEEIIESVQSKRPLRSVSFDGYQPHHSFITNGKGRCSEDVPPIVVIKPYQFPVSKAGQVHKDDIIKRLGILRSEELLNLRIMKENKSSRSIIYDERTSINKKCRELQVEKSPIRRCCEEKRARGSKVLAKLDVTQVKMKDKQPYHRVQSSVAMNPKQPNCAVKKNVDGIQKEATISSNLEQRENVRDGTGFTSSDLDKLEVTKIEKTQDRAKLSNQPIPERKTRIKNSSAKCTAPSHNSSDQLKNVKIKKQERKPLKIDVENILSNDEDLKIVRADHYTHENEPNSETIKSIYAEQLRRRTNPSILLVKENRNENQKPPEDATQETSQHKNNNKYISGSKCFNFDAADDKTSQIRLRPHDLLLSHVEALLNIRTCRPIIQRNGLLDSDITDSKLLVDRTNELVESKSLLCKSSVHPLLKKFVDVSRNPVSREQIIEEVCNQIENLRSFCERSRERPQEELMFLLLQRDLGCEGVLNRPWDFGWRNSYTVDDVEQIVSHVEKLTLTGLIEEALKDFMV